MHFERLVSLGAYCLPKFQIDRYIAYKFLGFPENSTLLAADHIRKLPEADIVAINGGNYLLDWVVIENYDKLINLLNTGLDYQLAMESLEAQKNTQGNIISISCQKSGIVWHHLFRREGEFVTGEWPDEVSYLAEKVAHLRTKFIGLAEYRTLYIVTLSPNHLRNGTEGRLADALTRLRQNDNFVLLVAVPDLACALPADTHRVSYRRFDTAPDFPQYPWLGNSASWDQMFSTFEINF